MQRRNRLKIVIKEKPKELLKLQRNQKDRLLIDRIRALYLYAIGEGQSCRHLGQLIGRATDTVRKWFNLYAKGGLAALLSVENNKRNSGKSVVSAAALAAIKARLDDPNGGFRSWGEMATFLKEAFSITVKITTLWMYVRKHLKVSFKRPRPSNVLQEEGAVETFQKNIGRNSTTASGAFKT